MIKENIKSEIDFVVLWVDGSDPEWIKEKNKYITKNGDTNENRFRDCDNLQYLFRGIEKYAPWVNNIFFITYGHIPSWLDTKNEKIKIVRHDEFIPHEYLPTFNSNVIELNLHRIEELSENFVLFNDDFYILKLTKPTDFFVNGIPTDVYVEYTQLASYYNDLHFFMKANILAIINKHFNKKEQMKKHRYKILHYKYGKFNFRTYYSMKYKHKYCGFWNFHAPQPYLKSNFKKIWKIEGENLDKACYSKFRSSIDLGHYLIRYWQMVEGNFVPRRDESKYFSYKNDNRAAMNAILKRKYKTICVNDAYIDTDFEKAKSQINSCFEKIFPQKSSFEI